DVHQARPLHPFRESDHVLRADHVRAQGAFERRIESHVAGGVDDYVDVLGDAFCLFFGETEIGFGDIAANDGNFVAYEILEGGAIALAHRIEWRRADYIVPKARLGFFLRTRAHRHVHAADIRKTMQEHAERDFADKAGAAN